jgi:hypothetical protein
VSFSKVLRWLLSHYQPQTMAALCGFMVGALRRIWPFQLDTTPDVEKLEEKVFENYWPQTLSSEVLSCVAIAVVAAAFVFAIAGNPWFLGDVGITGERIAAVGRLDGAEAQRTLDASGRFVTPGFVDAHGHSELVAVTQPQLTPKVMQGVTSEVCGNCGLSVAPISETTRHSTA